MAKDNNYVLAAGILIGLPSFATIASTLVAQNPSWRPFAITRELLENDAEYTPRDMIAVQVDWGRDRVTEVTHADLRVLVDGILEKRTTDYFIRIREVEGEEIDISFLVGPSSFGPYTPRTLIYGIAPAIAALRANKDAAAP